MKNRQEIIDGLNHRFDRAKNEPNLKGGIIVVYAHWEAVRLEIEHLHQIIVSLGGDPNREDGQKECACGQHYIGYESCCNLCRMLNPSLVRG